MSAKLGYTGRRVLLKGEDFSRLEVLADGRPLNLRLDIWAHSPDGFEAGYLGSGPAQLALAILADHLDGDDGKAFRLHQFFLERVIRHLPQFEDWSLPRKAVAEIIEEILREPRGEWTSPRASRPCLACGRLMNPEPFQDYDARGGLCYPCHEANKDAR